MSMTFSDFELAPSLQQALTDLEYTAPTDVQLQAIPAALAGKDLLVSSQTGSGKTAAFLLPTLNALAMQDQPSLNARLKNMPSPNILVLCPTRELAQQVSQDAIKLVRHVRGVRIATVMGGMPFGKQIAQLKGAQVLIATPGRLLDLVNRRQLALNEVDALIVDEADRMLDLGFSEDLEAIGDLAANRKQTLMFSATFADRIIHLAKRMMKADPTRIAIETGHSTNLDVTQTLHWTDGFEHKKKLLSHWLNDETMDQAVVFASTQEDTDMLAEELAMAGHQVVALHGAMPQAVRMRRIRSLREGKVRVLVATDVAARGLDVPAISHVINFGLPMKNEDYVHRIGRTGRAGRSGQAITLATHRERSKIRALEDYLQAKINVTEIAGLEPSPPPAGSDRRGRDGGRGGFGGGRNSGGYGRDGGGRSGGYSRDGGSRDSGGYRGNRDGAAAPRDFGNSEGGRGFSRDSAPRDSAPRGDFRDSSSPRPERDGQRFNSDRPRGNDENRGNRFDSRPSGDRPRPAGDRPYPSRDGGAPRSAGFSRDGGDRAPRGDFNRDSGAGRGFSRDGAAAPRPFSSPRAGGNERSFNSEVGGRSEGRVVGERNFNREGAANTAPARPRREFQAGSRDDRFERQERRFGGDSAPRTDFRKKRED
ncbi:DEAD/DEAH box helicase [Aquirhabdus sp.]|uniref:DEAD/DEAH box helicase n=1 Tax=Aquirhabdus sp. TaxID=2824160 RepID=UPI00396CA698